MNKVLWAMAEEDFKECEKLIKRRLQSLTELTADMNVHVYNEICFYIKDARIALEKARSTIKHLRVHGKADNSGNRIHNE